MLEVMARKEFDFKRGGELLSFAGRNSRGRRRKKKGGREEEGNWLWARPFARGKEERKKEGRKGRAARPD